MRKFSKEDKALRNAAKNGDIPAMAAALATKANIDCQYEETRYDGTPEDELTPLHFAVKEGHIEAVEFLVERGASNNAEGFRRSYQHITPLHLAAKTGRIDIARLLLKNGAPLEGIHLPTPLYEAAGAGYTDMVEFLLDSGAEENGATDAINGTLNNNPLLRAIKSGHAEIAMKLLDKGAWVQLQEYREGQGKIVGNSRFLRETKDSDNKVVKRLGKLFEPQEAMLGQLPAFLNHEALYSKLTRLLNRRLYENTDESAAMRAVFARLDALSLTLAGDEQSTRPAIMLNLLAAQVKATHADSWRALLEPLLQTSLTDCYKLTDSVEALAQYKTLRQFSQHVLLPALLLPIVESLPSEEQKDAFLRSIDSEKLLSQLIPLAAKRLLALPKERGDICVPNIAAIHPALTPFAGIKAAGAWHPLTDAAWLPDSHDLVGYHIIHQPDSNNLGRISQKLQDESITTQAQTCLEGESHVYAVYPPGYTDPISAFCLSTVPGKGIPIELPPEDGRTLYLEWHHGPKNTTPSPQAQGVFDWFKEQLISGAIPVNPQLGETEESKAHSTPAVIRAVGSELSTNAIQEAFAKFYDHMPLAQDANFQRWMHDNQVDTKLETMRRQLWPSLSREINRTHPEEEPSLFRSFLPRLLGGQPTR